MKRFLAAIALLLLVSQPASAAYFFSCGEFAAALASGDRELQNTVVGHAFGVADMIAGLLCFGRDPRCACLSNLDSGDFGGAFGPAIRACPANDPAFGRIFNAALSLCP